MKRYAKTVMTMFHIVFKDAAISLLLPKSPKSKPLLRLHATQKQTQAIKSSVCCIASFIKEHTSQLSGIQAQTDLEDVMPTLPGYESFLSDMHVKTFQLLEYIFLAKYEILKNPDPDGKNGLRSLPCIEVGTWMLLSLQKRYNGHYITPSETTQVLSKFAYMHATVVIHHVRLADGASIHNQSIPYTHYGKYGIILDDDTQDEKSIDDLDEVEDDQQQADEDEAEAAESDPDTYLSVFIQATQDNTVDEQPEPHTGDSEEESMLE